MLFIEKKSKFTDFFNSKGLAANNQAAIMGQKYKPALYPYNWQDDEFLMVAKQIKNQLERQLKRANKRKNWKERQVISERLKQFEGF